MKNQDRKVKGVIVPMITPFSSPAGEIDQAAVARIIAHLSAARAPIFLLGTTGESGLPPRKKSGRWPMS